MQRLGELDDGDVNTKRTKKRLFGKISKLKKQLKLGQVEKVERKSGWTEDVKKEMRAEAQWQRVSGDTAEVDAAKVETMLKKRTAAKKKKDYAVADEHAAALQALGVAYDDTTFTWFVKGEKTKKSKKRKKGEAEGTEEGAAEVSKVAEEGTGDKPKKKKKNKDEKTPKKKKKQKEDSEEE